MSSADQHPPMKSVVDEDGDDEWEYEYSAIETETYYLPLDLSIREYLEVNSADVVHGTRGGYRVWFNPLFTIPPPQPTNKTTLVREDKDKSDDEEDEPEREEPDHDDNIGMSPLDPALRLPEDPVDDRGSEDETRKAGVQDILQIMDLHTPNPMIHYRDHTFQASWARTIGTEMIFAKADDNDKSPITPLRRLPQGVHLIAASCARIQAKNVVLIPQNQPIPAAYTMHHDYSVPGQKDGANAETGSDYDEDNEYEGLERRYNANGGVYIHVGQDKNGERAPQARFLEDLIVAKRRRNEWDKVTITGYDTQHNELFHKDVDEERRRRKTQVDRVSRTRKRARELGIELNEDLVADDPDIENERQEELMRDYEKLGKGFAVPRRGKRLFPGLGRVFARGAASSRDTSGRRRPRMHCPGIGRPRGPGRKRSMGQQFDRQRLSSRLEERGPGEKTRNADDKEGDGDVGKGDEGVDKYDQLSKPTPARWSDLDEDN